MLAVRLVVVCLFAFLGYREAAKFERDNGRNAFGIPAWGWAIITGLSLLVGAILLHLARRSAAKKPAYGWPGVPQAPGAAPVATGSTGSPGPQTWAAPVADPSTTTSPNILPGSTQP